MRMTLATAALLFPCAALASDEIKLSTQWLCQFGTECRDTDCTASDYGFTVYLTAPDEVFQPIKALVDDPTSLFEMEGPRDNTGVRQLIGSYHRSYFLLTVASGGEARFSRHNDNPAESMTYLGNCHEAT